MHVLLLTHGTRGDVQPFLALARALSAVGHTATLAGPRAYAPLAAEQGVSYHPVDDGPNTLLDDPHMRGVIKTGLQGVRGAAHTVTLLREITPRMRRVYVDMAATADLDADVVVHIPGMPGAHIAERLGVPAVPVALQPSWVPTRAFPTPGGPWPGWIPDSLNPLSYRITALALRGQRGPAEELRRHLGLTPRPGQYDPLLRRDGTPAELLQPFSRHLLPPGTGYPAWVHTTGSWFLPQSAEDELSVEVEEFLSTGEPPVFLGFSSLPSADPAGAGRAITSAVQRAGVRAIVATGGGGIDAAAIGDDILVVDQVPHGRLFPRCSVIVHHAGAGTTATASASGRPQVVCPCWGDQPFWAARAHGAGIAATPLNGRRLTGPDLTAALTGVLAEPAFSESAAVLGEKVRSEGGVETAVHLLEELVDAAA